MTGRQTDDKLRRYPFLIENLIFLKTIFIVILSRRFTGARKLKVSNANGMKVC
jgi:hypothetical protein